MFNSTRAQWTSEEKRGRKKSIDSILLAAGKPPPIDSQVKKRKKGCVIILIHGNITSSILYTKRKSRSVIRLLIQYPPWERKCARIPVMV